MKTLTAREVQDKLSKNPDIKLVMVLSSDKFKKAHIPQSINIPNIELAKQILPIESKIIVYCSDSICVASYYAYNQLEEAGYQNVWRFPGGLLEWAREGLPLESSII